jgi:branched-chain amino acid transport system ATP-binding protein
MALLTTAQLRKSFGDVRAVDGVDFAVAEGEVLALIGSNGAGKTTLVNLISGLVAPDAGQIDFRGRDITALPVVERIRAGIARSFQIVNLFDLLSVRDNLALAIFAREGKSRRLTVLAEQDTAVREEAEAVLAQFGLQGKSTVAGGDLAQGERKLLDVAVAYALRPRLLLLDEPTSGVSTREKSAIMDVVTAVVRAGGISAVIIEHDMDVVFTYSDRIVVMHQGAILAQGTPEQIRRNAAVATTLLGAPAAGSPG